MCGFLKAGLLGFFLVANATSPNTAAAVAELKADSHVQLDMPVAGPFAYTHFCVRYADDCRVHNRQFRRPHPVALTTERRHDLIEVNARVNREITPKHYVNNTSFDTWRIAPHAGDCNDFAVTKRHELLARGWPSRALLLSEVVTSWGEHHLVLVVRTQHQDYVLDNLNANIRPWSRAPYLWVRAQDPYEPALWASVKASAIS